MRCLSHLALPLRYVEGKSFALVGVGVFHVEADYSDYRDTCSYPLRLCFVSENEFRVKRKEDSGCYFRGTLRKHLECSIGINLDEMGCPLSFSGMRQEAGGLPAEAGSSDGLGVMEKVV